MNTQTQQQRNQIDYNKIVNFSEDRDEILVLDYVFDHGAGFKGATGTRFKPVSREYYEEQTTLEAITEYLMDATNELPEQFRRGGFQSWAQAIIDNCEEEQVMFDSSYSNLWDYLRSELNLTEDEAYIFTCTGGGRCFGADFQGNYNQELSKIIREYESK